MKIVLFTGNLFAGGAQGQLCLLASEFQRRAHAVTVLTYNAGLGDDGAFLEPWLESTGIAHERLPFMRHWLPPMALRRALVRLAPGAVLAS